MNKKALFAICTILFAAIIGFVAFRNYSLFHSVVMMGLVFSSFTTIILLNVIDENIDLFLPKTLVYGSFISVIPLIVHFLSSDQLSLFTTYETNEYLQFWLLSSVMLVATYIITAYCSKDNFKNTLFHIMFGVIAIVGSILIHFGFFPVAFDNGITYWPINIRVLVIGGYIVSLFLLLHRKNNEPRRIITGYFISIIIVLVGEISIEFYSETNEISMLIFEYTRLLSFLVIFFYILIVYISTPLNNRLVDLSSTIEHLKSDYLESKKEQDVFRTLYENAPLGYQSLDENGDFLIVNDTFANMLGYAKSEMIGRNFGEFLVDTYSAKFKQNFPVFKKMGAIDIFFEMIHKKGHVVTMRFIGKIAYDNLGEFKQTHCLLMDISDEVEYQKGIIKSKSRLEDIISITTPGIISIDNDNKVLSVNNKALELLGYKNSNTLIGSLFNETVHKNQKHECKILDSLENKVNHNQFFERFNKIDDKEIEVICDTSLVLQNEEFIGVNIAFRDKITSDNIVQSLVELSYHDTLTGLFNRRYYEEEIKNIDKLENLPLSIIVSDINGLKLVNDAFGHEQGDQLLLYAKRVFLRHSTPRDFIARMGGDEFVIVMPNTDLQTAHKRIEDMTESAKEFDIDGVNLSISYGTGTKEKMHTLLDEIYKSAEDSMYRMKLLDVPSMRTNTIDTILMTLYEKDVYSEEHSRSVAVISEMIAKKYGLSYSQVNEVRTAAVLHDIGKIATPILILNKVGKLTDSEYEEIKKHPEVGYRILNSSSELRELAPIVLSHHEWWNGKGYPQGIEKENIPLLSRIISVADAYDAIISKRTYRASRSPEEALAEIESCAGTQFDPQIVKTFRKYFDEIVYGGQKKKIY